MQGKQYAARGWALRLGLGLLMGTSLSCAAHAALQTQAPPSPARVVDVRDFGAVADGRSDCRPAFQKALDAAAGGGEVRVPPGTYLLVGRLVPPSGVTLAGTRGQSRLQFRRGTAPLDRNAFHLDARGGVPPRDITWRDLEIFSEEAPVAEGRTMDYAIAVTGVQGLAAADLTVTGCDLHHFLHGSFSTNGAGYVERLRFTNNTVHHMGTAAMSGRTAATGTLNPAGSRDSLVDGNLFHDNGSKLGDWGLYASRDTVNLRVTNNVFRDNFGGAKFGSARADRLVFSRNQVLGSFHHSLTTDTGVSNALFEGNVIRPRAGGTGIPVWLNSVTDSRFVDNEITMGGAGGAAGAITLSGKSRNIEIARNRVTGAANNALVNFNGAPGVELVDITVRDNTLDNTGMGRGIVVNEFGGRIVRPRLTGNTVRTRRGAALQVMGRVESLHAVLNDFTGAEQVAVRFDGDGAVDAWVAQNRLGAGRVLVGGRGGLWEDNDAPNPLPSSEGNRFRRNEGLRGRPTLTAGATPSVAGSDTWTLAYAAPTVIRELRGGREGDRLRLLAANGNATLAHGSALQLAGQADRQLRRGDTVELLFRGGAWRELAGAEPEPRR